jgi:hypothetical protein
MQGLRGVRLETVKIGGARVTSTEALRRFFSALSGAVTPSSAVAAAAQSAETDKALDRIGI